MGKWKPEKWHEENREEYEKRKIIWIKILEAPQIPKIVKMNNFGEEERQYPNHLYK